MKNILLPAVEIAAAACLAGCSVIEGYATPENLARVAEAINAKIDDSDELSESGKAKLKTAVADAISKINKDKAAVDK